MNIEEAKANIGKEVVVLPETKPYFGDVEYSDFDYEALEGKDKLIIDRTTISGLVVIDDRAIHPQHIKLKEEKEMKEFKIKVANEAESKEAQELLFELGYKWLGNKKNTPLHTKAQYLYGFENSDLVYSSSDMVFKDEDNQEITLPQLRDLAVLHRNDVGDATHVGRSGSSYYCGEKIYFFDGMKWVERNISLNEIEPITKKPQMTWQDALRHIAEGKDVQYFDYEHDKWLSIKNKHLKFIMNDSLTFQLAPPTIHLEEGDYTKEGLLKIAGEME